MKRPRQHLIHKDEKLIFEKAIPSHWVARSQDQEDYGIDYEIEIFDEIKDREAESTGNIFKVQLKGTEKIKIIRKKSKHYVAFSMRTDSVKYLLEEIKIPTFLVVCDIKNEKCYWVCFQNMNGLKKKLDESLKENNQEMTIHLDVNTELKEDIRNGKLFQEYSKSQIIIADKIIVHSNIDTFSLALENLNEDEILKKLLEKADLIKYNKLLKFLDLDDIKSSEDSINNFLNSSDSTNKIKFFAIICFERIFIKKYILAGKLGSLEDSEISIKANLYVSNLLKKEFAKNNEEYFILYSQFIESTVELFSLTEKDYNIFLQLQLHKKTEKGFSSIWKDFLLLDYISLASKIMELIKKVQNNIKTLIEKKYLFLISFMTEKFIQSLTLFLKRLSIEKNNSEVYRSLYNNLTNLLDYSIELSRINKDYERIGQLEYQRIFLDMPLELKDVIVLKEEIIENLKKKVPDEEIKEKLIQEFSDDFKSLEISFSKSPNKKYSIEEKIHFYKDMIKNLGYDINDPLLDNDLKLAIKDLNPESVLKKCEYLYVSSFPNILGQQLKLNTLGEKILYCEKYDYCDEEKSLDILYDNYYESYCKNCLVGKQRHDSWKWSEEWNDKQNKRISSKFIKKMINTNL